ncbi:MAG TPA: transcriptional repressor [Methylomirabilota bacterium]
MIPKTDAAPPARTEHVLRARGLRLTRPRRVILDVVRATDAHPSAALVHRRVRRVLPRVSLATVYRNLRRLAAEGLLRERAETGGLRFDGNTDPHDHFTCLACGRVYDVPTRAGGPVRTRVLAAAGFEILDRRVEFYGRCVACRGRRRSPLTTLRRKHGRPKSERI